MVSNCCDLRQCIHYNPNASKCFSLWEQECQDCWHSKYNPGYGMRCNFATIQDMAGRQDWFKFNSIESLMLIPDGELIKEIKRRGLKI